MDLQLTNLRALVTGASKGLGYATALALAREGAAVAINSRDAGRLHTAASEIYQATNVQVATLPADVADRDAPQRLVDQTVQQLGGLDLLVTNAGGPPSGAFEQFDDDAWQKAIELSFMAHVRLVRAALPHLRRSNHAAVLTITSVSVKQPIVNLVLSNSVRAATVGLTKSLALELGGEGIRFNSILPSWTETERVNELMQARAQAKGTTIEQETARQAAESVLGRMGRPEEFANVAVFLLSPAASYLTGVMLPVDGGSYKGLL